MTPLLRGLAHLAAALGVIAWAAALGRWLRDPSVGASLIGLIGLAGLVLLALRQLYGPDGPVARRPAMTSAPDPRVDLNRAGPAELLGLPGVGPVTAQRILDERAAGGPFASVDDLARVPGFGPAKVRALRDNLRV